MKCGVVIKPTVLSIKQHWVYVAVGSPNTKVKLRLPLVAVSLWLLGRALSKSCICVTLSTPSVSPSSMFPHCLVTTKPSSLVLPFPTPNSPSFGMCSPTTMSVKRINILGRTPQIFSPSLLTVTRLGLSLISSCFRRVTHSLPVLRGVTQVPSKWLQG